jgi:hypothetical protein
MICLTNQQQKNHLNHGSAYFNMINKLKSHYFFCPPLPRRCSPPCRPSLQGLLPSLFILFLPGSMIAAPPPSPNSPFSKNLADANPTHFDSKFIDKELAKPNSMLEMALKEVEHQNKKKKPTYSLEWLPMVRLIVVFLGASSLWRPPHGRTRHIILVCVTLAASCLAALAAFGMLSCQSARRQQLHCPVGRLIVVFSFQFFCNPKQNQQINHGRFAYKKKNFDLSNYQMDCKHKRSSKCHA